MSPRWRLPEGQDVAAYHSRRAVGHLVDQQMIADEQRVFHGPGGDHERLHQRRGEEDEKKDGDGPTRQCCCAFPAVSWAVSCGGASTGIGGCSIALVSVCSIEIAHSCRSSQCNSRSGRAGFL